MIIKFAPGESFKQEIRNVHTGIIIAAIVVVIIIIHLQAK
jgi:hypothetical protein